MDTQNNATFLTHHLRARMGKVCVAITGSTPAELLQRADEASRENPFLEFRLDSVEKPQLITNKLKQFLAEHPLVTAIATCRRTANGGNFKGTVAEQIDHLLAAASAGCHMVDIELETAETLKKGSFEKFRDLNTAVMVSWHDFKSMPELEPVYAKMVKLAPDFYKIVPTAKTLADNLKLLHFLESKAEDANVVAVAMGPCGVASRLLGPRFGSLFTFAAATAGEETAPGQLTSRIMAELYRIDGIEPATRVYGVAGSPVSSSLSPLMINTGFRRETVNAVYVALETGNVKDLLKIVEDLPIHGLSVTMPLKEQVMPLLEKTDPLSEKIGACNTLVRAQDGKLYGFNTDVAGIVGPLERRVILRGAKVLVLGAGGAARAAVFGLKDKGADVTILNRSSDKAQKLARQSGAKVLRRDQLGKLRFDIIINATSYGMQGVKGASPVTAAEINCGLFFDLVYNPIETPLIKAARARGIPVVLGVEMFVQQGARQFEIWTGKPAPQEEMLRVVLHALRSMPETASLADPVPPGKEEYVKPAPPAPVKAAVVAPPLPAAPPVVAKKAAAVAPAKPAPAKPVVPVKAAAAPAKTAPSKTAPAKSAPAKKAAPAPAKKAVPAPAAKKTVAAQKPAAKKVAAKKPVTKKAAPAKKNVAKKTLVQKPQAKKAVAKKAPAAKKAAAKKPAPRKAPVKKKR